MLRVPCARKILGSRSIYFSMPQIHYTPNKNSLWMPFLKIGRHVRCQCHYNTIQYNTIQHNTSQSTFDLLSMRPSPQCPASLLNSLIPQTISRMPASDSILSFSLNIENAITSFVDIILFSALIVSCTTYLSHINPHPNRIAEGKRDKLKHDEKWKILFYCRLYGDFLWMARTWAFSGLPNA